MMLPGASRLSRGGLRSLGGKGGGVRMRKGVRCCFGAAGAPPGVGSSARDGEEDAACAAGEEDAAPSRGQALSHQGPGEEEEGDLSLSVPPQNHLERGEAPEHLTRKIQVCQAHVLAGRCDGFPGVGSRVPSPGAAGAPQGREGTFVMPTRTSPGDTPSPPCPPAVAAGRRQRATAARR